MQSLDTRFYKDTVQLVSLYNTNPSFKASFIKVLNRPRVTYKGRPLKLYVYAISNTSPVYKRYTRLAMDEANINDLFTKVYKDRSSFQKIESSASNPLALMNPEEVEQISKIDSIISPENKVRLFNQFIDPKLQVPGVIQDLAVNAQISTQKLTTTVWIKAGDMAKSGLETTGNFILGTGATVAGEGAGFLSGLSSLPTIPSKHLKIIFIVGIILIGVMAGIFGGLLSGSAGGLPGAGGGTGSSIGIGCPDAATLKQNSLDPNTCKYLNPSIDLFDTNISPADLQKFTDQYSPIFISATPPLGDIVEFNRRRDYIVNKSKQVGLNPSIFLGYWKTESNFGTSTKAATLGCDPGKEVQPFEQEVNCAVGLAPDGITRGGAVASRCASPNNPNRTQDCQADAENRAKKPDLYSLIPMTYPIATIDDFAESYGSRAPLLDGPGVINNNCTSTYNQLIAVAEELNMCKPYSLVLLAAPARDSLDTPQKLHDDILKEFNFDIDITFPYDYLKWIWEKLWNVKNTNFLNLVNPQNLKITIIRDDTVYNEQLGCDKIRLRGRSISGGIAYPENLFKVVFIHELGHIIENCNIVNSRKALLQQIINTEYITNFSKNASACVPSDFNINEDYAETISYFLNPTIPEQSLGFLDICEPPKQPDGSVVNPYKNNKPLHTQFAQNLFGVTNTIAQFSCPVIGGGPNILASFQKDPANGHCSPGYKQQLIDEGKTVTQCESNWRRAKSIDIDTCLIPGNLSTCGQKGKNVQLPTINNQSIAWNYLGEIPLDQGDCFDKEIVDKNGLGGGCGTGYMFRANNVAGASNWVFHLLHMGPAAITLDTTRNYHSGDVIGKTEAIHTHISVGRNITNPLSQDESGWLSVDTDLHLCE